MSTDAPPAAAPMVFCFEEAPREGDLRALLGGKGAGLVEMSRLGLPVPPGFIITTAVCRQYLRSGWPAGLDGEVRRAMGSLEAAVGAGFGSASAPLLVSVRSGAPVSMPGMMDTLLNVGMTPAVVESLGRSTGDALFAADCWLRFHRMYAETVAGVPRPRIDAADAPGGTADAPGGTAEARLLAAARFAGLAAEAGAAIPLDPWKQLRACIEAVFRSWQSERARAFRQHEGIPEEAGTAVVVQAMVFGNRDERSGTGVLFTRNPSTGEAAPLGDYLPRAQGEDVVAGTHAVHGLAALQGQLPEVYEQLLGTGRLLEHHHRDMCDIEFTVSSGRLYLLQVRPGRRTPLAAARMAVEMAEDEAFPLDRAGAVARVGADILARLAESTHVDARAAPLGRGLAASPGAGAGRLCFDPTRAAELAEQGLAVVLAREDTSPEDVHGMVRAAGIITLRGGVASHAAVVARSWSIPAVTSLAGASFEGAALRIGATRLLEGETVTVDGSNGAIYGGDCRQAGEASVAWAHTIREWAAELGVEPGSSAARAEEGGEGVSLFALARVVQLKGLCPTARAAACLQTSEGRVAECVGSQRAFFKETARGLLLTPEGRAFVIEELEVEKKAVGTALAGPFEAFLPLNARFKQLVTWWQTAGQQEGDGGLARLLHDLRAIQEELLPVVDAVAARVPRLRSFPGRLQSALAAIAGGDLSMVASPLKESYHTLWFEFHEELIALSGHRRTAADA